MEATDLPGILQVVQGGGNVALMLCVVVIHRASERLARIEKALDQFLKQIPKE